MESSPSADIKAKFKALQDEISSKAAQIKQEISKKLQNKAYVGFVKTKSDGTLILKASDKTFTVNTNQFTEVLGKKASLKTLTTDDYLVALGDTDETGALTAKRIIKLIAPAKEDKKFIFGEIININGKTLSLKNKDNPKFEINPTSGLEKLKEGQKIITFENKIIYIFDLGISPTASSAASPSGTKK